MSQADPYTRLIGPLRYVSQNDFARLSTVKNLGNLLQATLAELQSVPGADARVVGALQAALPQVDAAAPEARKAAIRGVIRALRAGGILGATPPGQAPPSAPPPPLTRPLAAQSLPGVVAPRKVAKGRKEAQAEARLLSIAPRAGPLALPLKDAGFKLSPRLVGTLNKKGVRKVGDVLFLLPRCYEDRRRLAKISELRPGERGVTVGVVRSAGDVAVRPGGRKLFRAVIGDETGSVSLSFFQSGPWLRARFPVGKRLVVSGELRASHSGREFSHPEVEPADELESSTVQHGRIVPIYPGFERHEQRAFRDLAFRVSQQFAPCLEEPLPDALRARLDLMGLAEALQAIHFPPEGSDLEGLDRHVSPAHRRLAFDELFFLQLGIALRRHGIKVEPGIAFDVSGARLARARSCLPFQLTSAQARAVAEIARDMGKPEPMNRLLQGDVGSGKTAVAVVAAALALQDGHQVALMAPTELLAAQHQRTLEVMLGGLGFSVGLVTSAGTPREKRSVREGVASGAIQVAVGTHALVQPASEFARLGLVVIDEQHRFGVLQRHTLMNKGLRPDVLVMTATPIPRTLAMTLYGDLDVSLIGELPPGRTPIQTEAFTERQRPRAYARLQAELALGHQAYVVYPLVEESEKIDLADATQGAASVQEAFPGVRVGLLHGRMKAEEKDGVMAEFRSGALQILVSTTVIEVGVDVPNASVMLIEHAERFGLSQLHQLRGRVGRGAAQSHCLLVAGPHGSRESAERLSVMVRSSDGFVIAEKDLELRGPGEFLGTRQSGLPELAVANLVRDQALLQVAADEARRIVGDDPRLAQPGHRGLAKALEERWEGRLALARVG